MSAGFKNYNWEGDENWKAYLKRIDLVGNESQIIEKAKKKYYQKYVDPNFDPNATNSSGSSTPSSTSTSSSSPTNNNSTNNPPPSTASSSSSSTSSARSAPVFRFRLPWLIAHVFLLINVVLYFVPFFDMGFSLGCYQRSLFSAIVAYGISLVNAIGFPEFNREYAMRMTTNDNTHYLFICLSMLSTPPITTMVLAMFIYSVLSVSVFLSNSVSQIPPQYQGIYRNNMEPLVRKALQNKEKALHFAAYFEVASLVVAIVNVFIGYGSLLTVLGLYWFINFRYMSSGYTQVVLHALGSQLDSVFYSASCPSFLRTGYSKIRSYLASTVQHRRA